jgi:predicted transcriptional regulator
MFSPRRPLLALTLLLLAALVLAMLAGSASAGEWRSGDAWASLSLYSMDNNQEEVVGDDATFALDVDWDGLPLRKGPILALDPIPQGWSYRADDLVPGSKGITLKEPGAINLTVTVSSETSPGTYYLEPRLDHPDEAMTLTSIPLSIVVGTYTVDLSVAYLPPSPARPGEVIEAELLVATTAPVDRAIPVGLDWSPEGWDVQFRTDTAGVQKGSSATVPVSLGVPTWAMPGDYTLILSTRTPDPRATNDVVEFYARVGAFPSLELVEAPKDLIATVGGSAATELVFKNDGNAGVHMYTMLTQGSTPLPDGWGVFPSGLPTVVPPFGQKTIYVTVKLPDDPLLARAGPTTLPISVMTGSPSTDLALELVVTVTEVRDLDIRPSSDELLERDLVVDPSEGMELSVELNVADRGNLRDMRRVVLSAEYDAPVRLVAFSSTYSMLKAGMEWLVVVTVEFEDGTEPGAYSFNVSVTDDEGASATTTVPVRVPDVQATMTNYDSIILRDGPDFDSDAVSVFGYVTNDGTDNVTYAKVEILAVTNSSSNYIGYIPIENLTTGETQYFGVTLEDIDSDMDTVEARLTVPGSMEPPESAYTEVSKARPAADAADEGGAWAPRVGIALPLLLGAAVGALAGLLAILGTEAGRFALLALLLIPLYTRLKPEQVENQFVRGQILGYVKANPGETYSHIRKALKLSNGQFVYHARILESQGLIKSIKDGANRRFYPEGMRIPNEVKDVELNQVQRIIYTIILEYPGISQSRIAKMMKLAPSTVNYHVNIMSKVGVIERRRSGRLSLCFAADETD